jgi:hypothetical protein
MSRHGLSEQAKTPAPSAAPALVDINEMSRRLGGIAVGTLYNWVYLRRIPFRKCGRCLRFDPDEVIRSLPYSPTMDLVGNG